MVLLVFVVDDDVVELGDQLRAGSGEGEDFEVAGQGVSAQYRVRHTPSGSSHRPAKRPSVAYSHGVHSHGLGAYPTR